MFQVRDQSILQLNSYHQDPHILFQFILTEFFIIYIKLNNIAKKTITSKNLKKVQSDLSELFDNRNQQNMFPWDIPTSHLNKLQRYCMKLSTMDIKDSQSLLHSVHELEEIVKKHAEIHKLVPQFEEVVHRIALKIKELLPYFINNENVLLFLLRHHEIICRLYEEPFLHDLLDKHSHNWENGISKFLEKRFSERGFDMLLPLINKKLNELKKNR